MKKDFRLKILLFVGILICLFDSGTSVATVEIPEKEAVTIQLRWSHQFQFAGYYAAIEKGFYADEGLAVTLAAAAPGTDRIAPVLDGRAQYGVGDAGVLALRADGLPLVVLAQIFQNSPSVLIAKRSSNILGPGDLVGKKIMLSGDAIGSAAIPTMITETLGGMDRVRVVPRTQGVAGLISGKVDAMAGYLSNEPFFLKQMGVDVNIIDPRSFGVDFYGDNLFTTERELADHPERVEKVLRATLKGWDYALKNKDEIIRLILARYNPHLTRDQLAFEAKVIDQMIMADLVPIGDINPRRYRFVAISLYRLGLCTSPDVPEGFIHNERPAATVALSAEERAWLKAHPDIRFAYSDDFHPALIVHEDGRLTGILRDMLDLLNQRLGTDFTIVVDNLPTIRNMIKNREVAGPLAMSPIAGKRYQLLQTSALLTSFPVVYARSNTGGTIGGVEDLSGRTCAIIGGSPEIERLVKPYDDRITITRTKTANQALKLLYEGKVDFFIGFAQHNYIVHTNQLVGIRPILALTDHTFDAVMGVRDDWPELVGILDKGLAAISDDERNAIYARWVKLPRSIKGFPLVLSAQEKSWLAEKHTVRVGLIDLPPFIFARQGQRPAGISIDILDRIAQRTGLKFSYDDLSPPVDDATETAASPVGPDLVPCLETPAESSDSILHSKAYMQTPLVVFTDQNALPVNGMQDLLKRTVSVKQGSTLQALISRLYPQIKLRRFETEQEALKAVTLGRTEAYIGGLMMASRMISHNGWTNLKVAGPSGLKDLELFFEIRSDRPELLSIVDKGLDSISEEERTKIRNQYMAMRYDHGISPRDVIKWIAIVAGVFGGLLVMAFLWNRTLARRVRHRTADLDLANKHLQDEIGERSRAEASLEESEQLARLLLNATTDLTHLLDEDGKIIDLNDAMADVLGGAREDLIGTCVFDRFAEETGNLRRKLLERAISEKKTVKVTDEAQGGNAYDVHIYPIETPPGQKHQAVVFAHDITARKRMEEKLKASEERLRKAQEIVHLGNWELDPLNGTFTWSDEVFRILEVDPAHFSTSYQAYLNAIHPDDRDRADSAFKSLLEARKSFNIKHRLLLPDGRIKYVRAKGETAYSPEGKAQGAIGTLQDVTERENFEIEATMLRRDLAHLNRVLTMGELSGYLAHEINQPLGAILNNASAAQVIHSQLPERDDVLGEILEDISKDAYRAGQIMRKIRGAVKKEDAKFERLNINDLLDEVVGLLQNVFSLDGITVRLDKHPGLPLIRGDRVRLQQVVINIVTNAVEAMRDSSPMILTIRSAVKPDAGVVVSITDSGPGIDGALKDELFQAFFTTKKSGLGVGLRICRSIIEEHGGQITAENNPDAGASFHFTLPTDQGAIQ
jgi:two-component system sensor histidine kinase EvgS